MFMILERIHQLRKAMAARKIDIYLVPTADFHASEYVGDYFKAREYLTGFNGSNGTLVVTQEEAGLWTDGRYFIQAENQLQNTSVILYRMEEEGVPKIEEYIKSTLPMGGCLGFDGRVVNAAIGEKFRKIAQKKRATLFVKEDLVNRLWPNRPALSAQPAYVLPQMYAGESTAAKLIRLRKKMKKEKADLHILTSLYDIAWLFNLRGNDIPHVPVVLSYAAITPTDCYWFVNEAVLNEKLHRYLNENSIITKPYNEIYDYAAQLPPRQTVLLCMTIVNYQIVNCLAAKEKEIKIIDRQNPTKAMKAVKNSTEQKNTRKAHILDGVAVTKFIYWLKHSIGHQVITERSASEYLASLRKAYVNFIDISFDTICAYGANAAMMHYSATEESDAVLKPEGFLLVDSGGHYWEGTTDTTRTIALGPLSLAQKRHYTAVCRGNLNLANAKFLYGCRGTNLDILARQPLWDMELDYKCGTGHGVGHILNVHEGPNSFRWKTLPHNHDNCVLEAGMITTDEPGVYCAGHYGIRIENELLCCTGSKNEYGQYMYFENITYVPIDVEAILPEEMTAQDKHNLNRYHKMVRDTLSPYLTDAERQWLKECTSEIK
jgi:Xaa-Pro aminopeptidase